MTEAYFYKLAEEICRYIKGDEVLLFNITGEDSDFVRFNNSRIRQPGSVSQCYLGLHLIRGKKHTIDAFTLAGTPSGGASDEAPAEDLKRALHSLDKMREIIGNLPEDPYLLYSKDPKSGSVTGKNILPSREEVLSQIFAAGENTDLVGIYTGGRIYRGFFNSLGQKNWSESFSFNLTWSYYYTADKAVKSQYAGFRWDRDVFRQKVESAREQLEILARPPHTIKPGKYNVYLAPGAVYEFISMACWGGFGLKSLKTRQTPFLKMVEGKEALSPVITISENTRHGIAPNFQYEGFIKPDAVHLVSKGKLHEPLVSPRSATEYGQETNGANGGEWPESLDMREGQLEESEILKELDTGIYINNAWYLNYSDKQTARITGMTRFATFWVQDGKIKAPLNVMRFDESLYRVFGSHLVDLTKKRDHIISDSTYDERATTSMRLPGALVRDFNFTL